MTTTPYLLTASGQRYRLTGSELDTPRIGDIAHHLAQINRFTGAASRPYSVAEHSLLCEHIAASEGAGPMARLCALMHDAHEAYVGDASSPLKLALRWIAGPRQVGGVKNSDFDLLESIHATNVAHTFRLYDAFVEHQHDVRRWDLIALATERRDLMPADDGDEWEILRGVEPFGPPHFLNDASRRIRSWSNWRFMFHDKFNELTELAASISQCPWCGVSGPDYRDNDQPATYCHHEF